MENFSVVVKGDKVRLNACTDFVLKITEEHFALDTWLYKPLALRFGVMKTVPTNDPDENWILWVRDKDVDWVRLSKKGGLINW